MVSLKKRTQDAFSMVYEFVPMQDFGKKWTDNDLYEKYGLDEIERRCIDNLIKPMA